MAEDIDDTSVVDAATEVEIRRQINELRRELLDDKATTVQWWLSTIAAFLAFVTVVAILSGLYGLSKLQDIEAQAQKYLDKIEANTKESDELLARQTSQDADNPEKAEQIEEAAKEVRENPAASLLGLVRADAFTLQRTGKIEKAIEKWRSIANVMEGIDDEQAARAWFSVGYLFQEESLETAEKANTQEALSAYDEAIRLKPDYAEAYDNRGIARSKLGQHEAAMADHSEAIRLKPNLVEAYYNRGNAKNALGQREAAIADYDEAIRLKPDYAEAYNNRGSAKNALGQREAAIADYDEAIRLKSDLAEAYTNRGIVKNALGQREAAIADHDEAIRLKPDYAKAYGNRGNTKAALGRMDDARQDFEAALALAREAGDENLVVKAERTLENLNKGEVQ